MTDNVKSWIIVFAVGFMGAALVAVSVLPSLLWGADIIEMLK